MKQSNIILEAKNVCISYEGKKNVIDDFSLSIRQGEAFGLIGLNGVGKTTFIKCAIGLRKQGSGTIEICGQDAALTQSHKNLAYLPERFDPPWFLTGYEFVKFTLDLYKKSFSKSVVDDLAERLVLDQNFLSQKAQNYSKGMRQKLGIIATLLSECPLTILDEPMSGLDPMARRNVKSLLLDHKKTGQGFLICSHILSDMHELCEDVAILYNGRLGFVGSPDQLLKETGESQLEEAFIKKIMPAV